MDNPIFPYGPTSKKLDKICSSLAKQTNKKVTLDWLETLGIPKTQVSVALSGLKQLGFVSPDCKITKLCIKFSKKESRMTACQEILVNVYSPLVDIVQSNPSAVVAACNSYLQRLGRGDSAREKILKLFWYFWVNSNRKIPTEENSEQMMFKAKNELKTDIQGALNEIQGNDELKPKDSDKNPNSADSATISLAESLIRFCESKEKLLIEKNTKITKLQEECQQMQLEIEKVREMLNQLISTYPGLWALVQPKNKVVETKEE